MRGSPQVCRRQSLHSSGLLRDGQREQLPGWRTALETPLSFRHEQLCDQQVRKIAQEVFKEDWQEVRLHLGNLHRRRLRWIQLQASLCRSKGRTESIRTSCSTYGCSGTTGNRSSQPFSAVMTFDNNPCYLRSSPTLVGEIFFCATEIANFGVQTRRRRRPVKSTLRGAQGLQFDDGRRPQTDRIVSHDMLESPQFASFP